MENIYRECIDSIEKYGTRFIISFKSRSLKFNGKYIIKDGIFDGGLGIEKCGSTDDFLAEVKRLYGRFKHSIPSSDDCAYCKSHFKALPESELEDEDMWYGTSRNLARFELEMYILSQIVLGFQWDKESMGVWFWQSKSDKDLVLLKDWF